MSRAKTNLPRPAARPTQAVVRAHDDAPGKISKAEFPIGVPGHVVSMQSAEPMGEGSKWTSLAVCECGWRSAMPCEEYEAQDRAVEEHWASVAPTSWEPTTTREITLADLDQMPATPPVALADMTVPQLTDACHMLDQAQERYDKLSGICGTMRGLVLTEVKHKLDHGKFLPWLNQHFDKTRKTAAEDMRLAREFGKCNPKVTFDSLGRDLASTVRELELAQIDLAHPLVREVADWANGRTRYQLLLDFPTERGGARTSTKAALQKSAAEIAAEEAQIFYFPLQTKLYEAMSEGKTRTRLLALPVTAPPERASLAVLLDELNAVTDLVKEAIRQKAQAT